MSETHTPVPGVGMDDFVAAVRARVAERAPDLLDVYDIYAQEARFARNLFAPNLSLLPKGAAVMEIGAGMMLFSCQMQREGFDVTSIEPVGDGFSHFHQLQNLVLSYASEIGCHPRVLSIPAELLDLAGEFDFACSANVMEHVSDVAEVLRRVVHALKPGGLYRFMCPNYRFPYEPHFNLPTLFSKRLTARVMKRAIFEGGRLPDPHGTWRSLNWITVGQVRAIGRTIPAVTMRFRRDFLADSLLRVHTDLTFASRRPRWLRQIIGVLVKWRIHRATLCVPVAIQPAIDCTIRRNQ
ncbi:class I SAM-dependent methyltransferase [Pandoraea sputorum]|uniref:class I SAM-dependent methyltransferase n=1 Tax=Pandoraea sputorum TaxID=93222 RepID=UPI001E3A24CE|nr:methyltransferase domain-containing protein [Pandoraea sputorum]MCE4061545.1 class I SAM-dependent methyltransferase [Pandoraea sputorum]